MLWKGFKFGLLLQLAVGPVCVFILQTSFASGFIASEMGVLGVTLVDALFILAATAGLGAILNRSRNMKILLKYFGALVLIVFGLSNVLSVFDWSFLPSFNLTKTNDPRPVFLNTLLLTLSNPLTILFWAGVFSAKISEDHLNKKEMLLFGIGAVCSTFLFLSLIALLGSALHHVLTPKIIHVSNVIVGILLILFGLKTLFRRINDK